MLGTKVLSLLLLTFNQPSIHQQEWEAHFGEEPCELSLSSTQYRIPNSLNYISYGYLPYWVDGSYLNPASLTHVAYFSLDAIADGNFNNKHGWPKFDLVNWCHQYGLKCHIVCTNFNPASLTTLLSSSEYRSNLVLNLLQEVIIGNADGVNIDFEGVPGNMRNNLLAFMTELYQALKNHNPDYELTIATPPVDWSSAFDIKQMSSVVDYFMIMCYNYYWSGSEYSGPNCPLEGTNYNFKRTIDWYLSQTDDGSKILAGIPYYGVHWTTLTEQPFSATIDFINHPMYSNVVSSYLLKGDRIWHESTSSPYIAYQESAWHQVWYDDSLSLALKYDYVKARQLVGMGIWALGYDGSYDDLSNAIIAAFSHVKSIPSQSILTTKTVIILSLSSDVVSNSLSDFIIFNLKGQFVAKPELQSGYYLAKDKDTNRFFKLLILH